MSVSPATAAPASAPAAPRRRASGWAAIAGFLVVVGAAGAALSGIGGWAQRDALDPDGAGPEGTRALAELLREGGVEVTVVRERAAALDALDARPSTLVTADSPLLSDDSLTELFSGATDVVLIDPRARAVDLLLPGATAGGYGTGEPVEPGCALGDAQRSGAVVPGRLLTPPAGSTADACYPDGDGYGLLSSARGSGRVSILDARGVLTNEVLAEHGNAALGMNLLGRLPHVVWYVPGDGDADFSPDATLGELTPGWVTPVLALLALTAAAAALARRRLGPLVVERLPVTVRLTETMEGRARLYARGRDHGHAADALRMGATTRWAQLLGLGTAAGAHDVADAVAGILGLPREGVRGVLVDRTPQTDAELMHISDALRDIESALEAATRSNGHDT